MTKNADLFNKCSDDRSGFFSEFKDILEQYRKLPGLSGSICPHMISDGHTVINWSYNDYLGLANHPSNRKIEIKTIEMAPSNAPMGSRLFSDHNAFNEFESKFASYVQCEQTMTFATGYLAAIGAIPALAGPGDIILIDSEAHSCLFDSVKLAMANGAHYKLFKHNDMQSLESLLTLARQDPHTAGIMIICDGVYSMRGDLAILDKIIELKNKYDARIFLDDAHGGGIMGKDGKGTAHHFGVHKDIDLVMHTFSKAFASTGACISGNNIIIDYLRRSARTYIFSHNMQLIFLNKVLNSIHLIQSEPKILKSLWVNSVYLQSELKSAGFNIGNTQSPITPVIINVADPKLAINYLFQYVCRLREDHHIFVSAVTYPAVPSNMALIRLIPTTQHSLQDIDNTVKAFISVRKHLGPLP